jgi:cation transport ATPase
MFSLIGLGTGTAWLFSAIALLWPQLLPQAFKVDGAAPLYFESAATITTLVLLGQVLELRARSHTGSTIRSLLALAPTSALRIEADGREHSVPLQQVRAGIVCASGRARNCRWMAKYWKAARVSMNR